VTTLEYTLLYIILGQIIATIESRQPYVYMDPLNYCLLTLLWTVHYPVKWAVRVYWYFKGATP